jgi:hypothetical protein
LFSDPGIDVHQEKAGCGGLVAGLKFTARCVLPYGALAELTVVVHLGWILFLVFGVLLGRRFRWVRRLHLAGLGFAVMLTAFGWFCPLTHLEVWLRQQAAGHVGYRGSFIGHYANRLVYLDVPREAVLAGAIVLVLGSLAAYFLPPGARSRRRSQR